MVNYKVKPSFLIIYILLSLKKRCGLKITYLSIKVYIVFKFVIKCFHTTFIRCTRIKTVSRVKIYKLVFTALLTRDKACFTCRMFKI